SSRRRHTRFSRDWSSDVCSSDLMPTWNPRANDLFLKALELRSPGERQEYLDGACAGDAALRAEVEALLEASARAGSFLESPVSRSEERRVGKGCRVRRGACAG